MKTKITLAILLISINAGFGQDYGFRDRELDMLRISGAYPNNPALYRYLERNPRHIPFYLGE